MNYKKIIINTLFIFLLEMIFHFELSFGFNYEIIYIFLFSLIIGIIISLLCSILKSSKINKIVNIIFIILTTIIFIAQLVHFKFYNSIFSTYSLVNGGQVADFYEAILKVIKNNIIKTLLLLIPSIIAIITIIKIKYEKYSIKASIITLISTIILFVLTILSFNINKLDTYSSFNLYHKIHVPTFTCEKLGLITTMRLDLQRVITKFEENPQILLKHEAVNKEVDEKDIYNILDIDFDSLINNEKKQNIKNLHNYFKNEQPTKKNRYTGLFKNKNLIFLTAEAFSPIAIDKDLTPTLYKLYNESIRFNNFYTPLFNVSTSDGEYMTLTSLLPKEGVWSFQESSKNDLPFVFGNILKDYGYSARAYHNGQYKYYKRNLSHPNMGYKFTACGNGLEKKINCRIWPQSDLEMINATFNDYKNEERFVTYYMTISGHLNYNFYGNTMALRNKSKVKNLNYSNSIKAYMATHIELDKALESLINKLTEAKLIDDTVIVITADHYPYGLTIKEMKEKADYINDSKFDIHKNNLIIWNKNLKEKIGTDKYACSIDILPTILNLFGISYDSRLLIGKDILSDSQGIAIYNDRSWITEYGKFNSVSSEFTSFKKIEDKKKYVDSINELVKEKFSLSRSILENNYYKYLKIN